MSFWQKLFGGKTDEQSEGVKNNQNEMRVEDAAVNAVADQPLYNEPQAEPEQVVLPMDGIETLIEEEVVASGERVIDEEEQRKQ